MATALDHKYVRVTLDLVVPVAVTSAEIAGMIELHLWEAAKIARCKVASVAEDVSTPVWEMEETDEYGEAL